MRGKKLHALPLRIRPVVEICFLRKVQTLQVLIRAVSLSQKSAHNVRGINIGRVNYLLTYFHAHAWDAFVDIWRGK